ncbi:MAG: zinc ribbon domain-containing protein [Clostridia bacterium]|nr:zinc ribbon domain-containing protein [Clostridia bacterium]
MYCSKCGATLQQGQRFCPKCGAANIQHTEDTEVSAQSKAKNTCAPADEQAAASAKPKKKKGHKAFIIIVVILALLVGGMLIFMQTNFYKIKKAEHLIGKGKLGEAKSVADEVSSAEGDALGAYMNVLEKKQDFLTAFNASKQTAGEGKTNLLVCTKKNTELYIKSNAFLDAFKTFQNEKDAEDLPKSMQEDYNYCKKVIDSLYDTGFSKEMFYKVQTILLTKLEKNHKQSFTLKQVQESVDVTQNAYKQIESVKNTLKNISSAVDDGEYICLSGSYYKEISGFVEAMDVLAGTSKAEADNEQQAITDDLKKNSDWTMNTELYLKNKDENYSYSFGQYFEPVSNEQSASDNADLVMNSLQVGILGLYLNHVEEA